MSETLFTYMQDVQKLLRDTSQHFIDPQDIIQYVNRARREVAMRTQCVRRLTPVSGSIRTATITNPGNGKYNSAASIVIGTPDFPSGMLPNPNGLQASASMTIFNGTISAVQINVGGDGYFQPTVTITDVVGGAGSGASVSLTTSLLNTLNQGQEVYPFSGIDLSPFPGVQSILAVKGVSIIYSNWRYSVAMYSFSTYQAKIRQFPASQYQWTSVIGAQFGQGVDGSFFMYPVPAGQYQMEWDCLCIPSDLVNDLSPEAIPRPWTEAVPYFAAYLAYMELQNFNSARFMEDQFDKFCTRYGSYARPGRITNPYGRF